MSNISNTNSTYATGGIDTQTTLDASYDATFQQMNGAASGVIAIETIIGDGPTAKGSKADLVTRLANFLNAAGEILLNTNGVFNGGTDKYGLIFDSANKKLVPKNTNPIGGLMIWGDDTAPTNWIFAAGQAVSRTTYADLFALWGTRYGVGDGATTFNVIDLRGRVPLGQDDMGGSAASRITAASFQGGNAITLGGVGGEEAHTLTVSELASHDHSSTFNVKTSGGASLADYGGNNSNQGGASATSRVASQGGGGAHSNTQPWIALNYIIYVGV